MPHPVYNGQAIPVYSVPPNWKATVTLRTLYQTLIRESLDLSEERQERQPRCLYGIRYRPLTLSGQETGYIRRVLELAQAMPVVMPVWTEACMILANAGAGATTLTVDDTSQTLFPVLRDYVFIFRDFKTWEVLEIDSISAGEITLAEPTAFAWQTGDFVYPILIGKLPRSNMKAATDIHASQDVDFEERFNGLTDQSLVEEDTPELEVEFTSACRETARITTPVPEGATYILQISESLEGPWHNHVWIEGVVEEIFLNNDYNGEKYFRLIDAADSAILRRPVNIQASVVAPPTLEDLTGTIDSPNPLQNDGGDVYPYSQVENDMISPTELYIVPRGRKEHFTPAPFSWDGIGVVPDFSGPAGAVIKWTRDGNDPTENTIIRNFDGHVANAAPYREDFKFVIKARCFKDGCRSPMTLILVDRRIEYLFGFNSTGLFQLTGGFCGLPHPESGAEPGDGCIRNYGSVANFDEALKVFTIGAATGPAGGGHSIYYLVDDPATTTYIGWPIHTNGWSYYEHTDAVVLRQTPNPWEKIQRSFMFFWFKTSNVPAEVYLEPLVFGETLATVSGDKVGTQDALDQWIEANTPDAPTESAEIEATVFDLVLTLHHDFAFFRDPDYEPPVTDPPIPPDDEVGLGNGDDFEDYAPDTDLAGATLDAGAGWDAATPWLIETFIPLAGEDDFEGYSAGPLDLPANDLNWGDGWAGPWLLEDSPFNVLYGDDFESYTVGPMNSPVTFNGGTGWGASWKMGDAVQGIDTFETYALGAFSTGADGSGWSEDWVANEGTPVADQPWLYFRWNPTSIIYPNGSWIGVFEVELRETPGGTNWARSTNGGIATAEQVYSGGGYEAAKAIDGDVSALPATGWANNGTNGSAWLQVQLSQRRVIGEYKIGHYPNTLPSPSFGSWTFSGSLDGVSFTVLHTVGPVGSWSQGEMKTYAI